MDLDNINVAEMTDEQIDGLLKRLAEGKDAKPEQKPQQQTQEPERRQFQLPNGEIIGGTVEEINQQLAYRLAETAKSTQPQGQQASGATQVDKPNWSYDEFVTKFKQDPDQGIGYMYKSKYGYNPVEAMPAVVDAIRQLAAKVDHYEKSDFQEKHKDFKQTPKNEKILQDMIAEGRAKSREDAYILGKAHGLLELEDEKPPEPQQTQPQQPTKMLPGFEQKDFQTTQFDPNNPNNQPPHQVGVGAPGGMSFSDIEERLNDVSNDELRSFVKRMEQQGMGPN